MASSKRSHASVCSTGKWLLPTARRISRPSTRRRVSERSGVECTGSGCVSRGALGLSALSALSALAGWAGLSVGSAFCSDCLGCSDSPPLRPLSLGGFA